MCPIYGSCLGRANLGRFRTFYSLSSLIFDFLTFFERFESLAKDIGVMDEQILAAVIGDDKSKSLLLIEPFYCACCHKFLLRPENGPCINVISLILTRSPLSREKNSSFNKYN